jgi:hypothetical protein
MDMLLELLLLVHNFVLVMRLLVLLMLFPWELLPIFQIITLVLFLELIFYSMLLRVIQRFHFQIKFCIMLTLMISWVQLLVMYPCPGFPSICWLTLWDPGLGHFSLFTCRMEILWWRTYALMISVFCLEWLRYKWFSISLFMPSSAHVVMWHLQVLCEYSHTLSFTITCSVESVHVLTWLS